MASYSHCSFPTSQDDIIMNGESNGHYSPNENGYGVNDLNENGEVMNGLSNGTHENGFLENNFAFPQYK